MVCFEIKLLNFYNTVNHHLHGSIDTRYARNLTVSVQIQQTLLVLGRLNRALMHNVRPVSWNVRRTPQSANHHWHHHLQLFTHFWSDPPLDLVWIHFNIAMAQQLMYIFRTATPFARPQVIGLRWTGLAQGGRFNGLRPPPLRWWEERISLCYICILVGAFTLYRYMALAGHFFLCCCV